MFPAETDLVCKEREGRELFRERAGFGFGDAVGFSTIKGAIIAPKMITPVIPNRYEDRHIAEAVTAMKAEDG